MSETVPVEPLPDVYLRLGESVPDQDTLIDAYSRFRVRLPSEDPEIPVAMLNLDVRNLFDQGVKDAIQSSVGQSRVTLLEYAYGFFPGQLLMEVPWKELGCLAVTIEFAGMPKSDAHTIRRLLLDAGLHPAGGGIRATGSDEFFLCDKTIHQRTANRFAYLRSQVGHLIVWSRRHVTNATLRRARWNHLLRVLNPWAQRSFVLDSTYGIPITQVNPLESQAVGVQLRFREAAECSIPFPSETSIDDVAHRCYAELGVWPISFSYPYFTDRDHMKPRNILSSVVPGHPYSFDEPGDYLRQYAESHLAITHRKAGWDCFRHVEILASGSIPLMLDVESIPEYSMVHYPKPSLQQVRSRAVLAGEVPDAESRQLFHEFFRRHLTSQAMTEYMLAKAGLSAASRVLFIDEQLQHMPDYQSVLALIGLKQLLGKSCEVAYPVPYVYQDWIGNAQKLYGRGFGYTRVLGSEFRSPYEKGDESSRVMSNSNWSSYDAVVVGSISRNLNLAIRTLDHFPRQRTIWIHGEDSPPSWQESRFLQSHETHLFVRAINH